MDPATLDPGCYEDHFKTSAEKIAGCTCHSSCRVCGYGPLDFVQNDANRCLSCSTTGFAVDVVDNQSYGTCRLAYDPAPLAPGCYLSKFENTKINGCLCDANCKACGYGPTSTARLPGRCLSCISGFDLLPAATGITYGTCVKTVRRLRALADSSEDESLVQLPDL